MHSLLETYLGEVSAHLGALPEKLRAEEVREMRGHLEAAYAAGLASGKSGGQAAREAFAQFGTPEDLGSETVAAWRRGRDMDRRSFWGAVAFGLVLFLLLPHLMRPLYLVFLRQFGFNLPFVPTVIIICWGTVECLLIGWSVGVLFPRRAVSAVGLAWGARTVWGLAFQVLHWDHAFAWSAYPLAYTPQQAIWSGLTVLLCLVGAWAGSRWRTMRVGRARTARG